MQTKRPRDAWNYEAWVQTQSEKIASAVNRLAMNGIYDESVYLLPANGATPGELVVSTERQSLECVRFGHHGSRVSAIPRSHLTQAIWNACRRLPIVPVTP